MSGKATFDGAPERGTINFSVGQPSADLLPLALLATAGQRFFAGAEPLELNYGQRQGDARFRAALAAFLGESGGSPVDPDSLMLTGGISQALDLRLQPPGEGGRRRLRRRAELSLFVPDLPRPRARDRRRAGRRSRHGHRAARARARASAGRSSSTRSRRFTTRPARSWIARAASASSRSPASTAS